MQAVALSVWKEHFWLGVGYDELPSYASVPTSAHNGLITSLFHGGVIGTTLLMSILGVCYYRSLMLWWTSKSLATGKRLLNQSLVFAAWLWIVPFLTQEILLEKHAQSIQYLLLGSIVALDRYYRRRIPNVQESVMQPT